MYRRTRTQKEPETLNIYPAFTDLMSNAFMILSLFLLLALLQSEELNRKLRSATPITIDEKSGNFKFKSGSAELNPQLKNHVRVKVIPDIEKIIKEKGDAIDFIQVIGHTDGQANNKISTLDQKIELAANGKIYGSHYFPINITKDNVRIRDFDPYTRTYSSITITELLKELVFSSSAQSPSAYGGATLAPNGKLYFSPTGSNFIAVVNGLPPAIPEMWQVPKDISKLSTSLFNYHSNGNANGV